MDTTDQIAITIDSKVSEKNENNSFQLYKKVLKTLCFTVDENGVRRLKEPICDEICLGKGYKQNSLNTRLAILKHTFLRRFCKSTKF